MESVLVLRDRLYPRIVPALVGAQVKRVGLVGVVVPMIVGALIPLVGAIWSSAWGTDAATLAMLAFVQFYAVAVGMCAVTAFTGDPLVEVQAAMPVEFRAVQTVRAVLLLAGGAVGALAMFVPLETLGLVYADRGWIGAVTPVAGAMIMVLVAYAAVAAAESARAASLVVVATWLFFALFWDPNVISLVAQRGAPSLVALALAAGAWKALGVPGFAQSKKGEGR